MTEILYLACLLARFLFFAWLYLLFVSAWFATALLSLGTRLGSPPRHFYGGAQRVPPIKIMGGELLFACSALLRLIPCLAAKGQAPIKIQGDTSNLRALLYCLLGFT